jgi:rubrerythrin
MNWKLYLSTFALIFLAELGDKTQLAAMARAAAGEGAKWTVFAGASSALVLSTLIAVLAGTALTRVVPEHYIKIAAGVLFVVFGSLILVGVLRKGDPVAEAGRPKLLFPAVMKLAAEFEEASCADYKRLASEAKDPAFQALMESLAQEEAKHLEQVRHAKRVHGAVVLKESPAEALPERAALAHDVAASDRPILQHVLEHEEATAKFYAELARVTHVPALKAVFAALAEEERSHLARIQSFAEQAA